MDWFQSLIGNQNQFLSGGLILMAIGGAAAYLRKAPQQIYSWLKAKMVLTITIRNEDRAFDWISTWLSEHPYMQKSRRLAVSTFWTTDKQGKDHYPILFTPAVGIHLFWYKGRLVWLDRERDDKANENSMGIAKARESYRLTILGRNQKLARALLDEAKEAAVKAQKHSPGIFSSMWGEWERMPATARSLSTIILPKGEKEALVSDVEKFLSARDWYATRGIPWRRGYLLAGIPGSGKSSVAGGLADHFGLNLYSMNLGSVSITDEKFTELLHGIRERSILLLEDLDAVTSSREEDTEGKEKTRVSLSTLLNGLDGVAAREGIVVLMTTNYPERLDPALIRSGRVDFRMTFGKPTEEQVQEYLSRFYPDWSPSFNLPEVGSMAELQELCLKSPKDPINLVPLALTA